MTSPQPWNVGTIQWTNGWKPAGSSGGLSCSAGGATAIPRWTLDPAPGVAEHVAALDDDLGAAVRRLADELELPLHSVALAAHAKVLAALSGEQDVVTGYAGGPGGRPLPCPLTTEARSWRSLLQDTCRVESDLLRHRDFAVDELKRELGVAGPAFETEFDPIGSLGTGGTISTGLAEDTVLRLALVKRGGQLALHLRYRTDALDPGSAERIAGYHLTALALMVADPGAEHGRANLLSDEELRFQLDGLAGPRRELPDRRFHELFEQRVRMHPDAVAAVHRDRQWTYRELNAHANRLARALLARGLRREGVVAVVTERNLDWMAAVIAIFKAGGAYLPIEPHFPADRIATMLARAECTLVLTELGSTTMLDKALDTLPGVQKIIIEEACAEGHADERPGRRRGGRSARLHLLHLRLHRRAQGSDVRARGPAQPPQCQDRRPRRGSGARRARGRPDRAAVLRHLAVATGVGAPRRGANPDRRAGGNPRRRAVRRHDRPTAGSASCRSSRPISRSC